MNTDRTKRFTYLAMLSALAIVLNIFETVYIGALAYNVRIGLANIAALCAMKILGVREMIIVNLMRVLITGVLRGTLFTPGFFISFAGVFLSSITLFILDKTDASVMFTSIMSAVAHTAGQVIMVCILYSTAGIALLLGYLLIGSVIMGILTGIAAGEMLKRVKPLKKRK